MGEEAKMLSCVFYMIDDSFCQGNRVDLAGGKAIHSGGSGGFRREMQKIFATV